MTPLDVCCRAFAGSVPAFLKPGFSSTRLISNSQQRCNQFRIRANVEPMFSPVVCCAARTMFGHAAALVALLLLVFDPPVIGYGAEVTTDVRVTCWFFGAVYAFYRYTSNSTIVRLMLSGLAAGLTVVSKHSGAA